MRGCFVPSSPLGAEKVRVRWGCLYTLPRLCFAPVIEIPRHVRTTECIRPHLTPTLSAPKGGEEACR
jgi:hypothetical protein